MSATKDSPKPATPGAKATPLEDTRGARARPVDKVLDKGGDADPSPRAPDTAEGAGDRHLHVRGDRLAKQLDENQSQSDRNPAEGANRDPPLDEE